MTATSVSITVQSLKEMGKLKGKVGTTILSAAIIDDVIGIIVLTFVIGFKSPENHPGKVVLSTVLFRDKTKRKQQDFTVYIIYICL